MGERNGEAAIAVIGAGAAGLAAAIVAAEALRGCEASRVVLCEASDRVGRSILATGNGRCNFSNARLAGDVSCDAEALEPLYRNAGFVAQVFAALEGLSLFKNDASERVSFSSEPSNAVLRFFADHGLVWREEGEGRLYPLANKASSVLDVLRAAVDAARVEALTDFAVSDVRRQPEGGFFLKAEDGRGLHARRVVLAVGGAMNERLATSLGLPFKAQRPVLGPLAVEAPDRRITKRLDNIRVKTAATLLRDGEPLRREQGEALFRTYGVSGIVVFDLSRDARACDEISFDLLPQRAPEQTERFLEARTVQACTLDAAVPTYGSVLRGMVLPQVAEVLCERAGIRPGDAYEAEGGARLARVLHDLRFTVEGIGDARQCQVKRGGVSVDALDAAALEARTVPGLHVAGEAADVDAACGGFNLHWAWASGMLAGFAAALGIEEAR